MTDTPPEATTSRRRAPRFHHARATLTLLLVSAAYLGYCAVEASHPQQRGSPDFQRPGATGQSTQNGGASADGGAR